MAPRKKGNSFTKKSNSKKRSASSQKTRNTDSSSSSNESLPQDTQEHDSRDVRMSSGPTNERTHTHENESTSFVMPPDPHAIGSSIPQGHVNQDTLRTPSALQPRETEARIGTTTQSSQANQTLIDYLRNEQRQPRSYYGDQYSATPSNVMNSAVPTKMPKTSKSTSGRKETSASALAFAHSQGTYSSPYSKAIGTQAIGAQAIGAQATGSNWPPSTSTSNNQQSGFEGLFARSVPQAILPGSATRTQPNVPQVIIPGSIIRPQTPAPMSHPAPMNQSIGQNVAMQNTPNPANRLQDARNYYQGFDWGVIDPQLHPQDIDPMLQPLADIGTPGFTVSEAFGPIDSSADDLMPNLNRAYRQGAGSASPSEALPTPAPVNKKIENLSNLDKKPSMESLSSKDDKKRKRAELDPERYTTCYRCPGCDTLVESRIRVFDHIKRHFPRDTMSRKLGPLEKLTNPLGIRVMSQFCSLDKDDQIHFLNRESLKMNLHEREAWVAWAAAWRDPPNYPGCRQELMPDYGNVGGRNANARYLNAPVDSKPFKPSHPNDSGESYTKKSFRTDLGHPAQDPKEAVNQMEESRQELSGESQMAAMYADTQRRKRKRMLAPDHHERAGFASSSRPRDTSESQYAGGGSDISDDVIQNVLRQQSGLRQKPLSQTQQHQPREVISKPAGVRPESQQSSYQPEPRTLWVARRHHMGIATRELSFRKGEIVTIMNNEPDVMLPVDSEGKTWWRAKSSFGILGFVDPDMLQEVKIEDGRILAVERANPAVLTQANVVAPSSYVASPGSARSSHAVVPQPTSSFGTSMAAASSVATRPAPAPPAEVIQYIPWAAPEKYEKNMLRLTAGQPIFHINKIADQTENVIIRYWWASNMDGEQGWVNPQYLNECEGGLAYGLNGLGHRLYDHVYRMPLPGNNFAAGIEDRSRPQTEQL